MKIRIFNTPARQRDLKLCIEAILHAVSKCFLEFTMALCLLYTVEKRHKQIESPQTHSKRHAAIERRHALTDIKSEISISFVRFPSEIRFRQILMTIISSRAPEQQPERSVCWLYPASSKHVRWLWLCEKSGAGGIRRLWSSLWPNETSINTSIPSTTLLNFNQIAQTVLLLSHEILHKIICTRRRLDCDGTLSTPRVQHPLIHL